jgi:hypothetical protein
VKARICANAKTKKGCQLAALFAEPVSLLMRRVQVLMRFHGLKNQSQLNAPPV